ncbi:hypothetical protein [Brooklawnia cerclae]|uniref:Uncharacterized protein n=2 Tax=Brooklawnia cerclae TaxID=349934 RepID=A0ABX0SFX4_9ACTN|nr:hypothetical protein [Brooklawnia cerclae]NIH57288.1 hypothetical protein [Brooklawnia cerclae]
MTETSSTRLVWDLAGRPRITAPGTAAHLKDSPGVCAMCGHDSPVTANADRALGKNFSDQGHLQRHDSPDICPACLWCASGKPPNTLRMWTIVASPGADLPDSQPKAFLQDTPGLCLTSRASTRPVIDILADPPSGDWLVSVALSGQKHVLPFAAVNHGSGQWTVRVEDHSVTATPAQWRQVHACTLGLRRLGVPAEAVMAGEPQYVKTPDQLAAWRDLNAGLLPWLGSPLLELALWTITKDITNDTATYPADR